MKAYRIIAATLAVAGLLAGCVKNETVDIADDNNGQNIWTESNQGLASIGIGDATLGRILDNVTDYVVCINIPTKESTNNELLGNDLKKRIENRAIGDEDVECPQNCADYQEQGVCEHTKEIEKSLKTGFNQDEEIDWVGGKQKIKDIKLNVISYSTYYMDDKTDVMFVVHMSGSPIKDAYAARVHYNAETNTIESIEI